MARLSGTTAKTFENDLKTFADFYARIDEVSTIVNGADKATINGRDESTITIGFGPGKSVDVSATGGPNFKGPDGRPPLSFMIDTGMSSLYIALQITRS